eukprot:5710658-Prymnesium_polylepis.1
MNRSRWSGASLGAAQSVAPFGTLLFPKVFFSHEHFAAGGSGAACAVPDPVSNHSGGRSARRECARARAAAVRGPRAVFFQSV